MKKIKSIVWMLILSVAFSTLLLAEGNAAGSQRRGRKKAVASRSKARKSSKRIARGSRRNSSRRSVRASVKRRNRNDNAIKAESLAPTPKPQKNCVDCGRKDVKIGI